VVTRELAAAVDKLREAQRCVQDQQEVVRRIVVARDEQLAKLEQCRRDVAKAQTDVDRATAHQDGLKLQLSRVEYTLASGGLQKTLRGTGGRETLLREQARLRGVLRGG
jgi:hypothetical protein